MGIPPRLLDDDEQVVLEVRPHGRVLLGPVLVVLVVAPVTAVVAAAVPDGSVGSVLRLVVLGLGVLVVVRGAVAPWLVWRSTTYTVTTHRVSVRRGVLHRFGRDVSLGRVDGVTFRSGPWDRLFGSGRMRIDTAGEGPLVLDDVPAVERVQRAVQAYADLAAQDDEEAADDAVDESGVAVDGWDDGWDDEDDTDGAAEDEADDRGAQQGYVEDGWDGGWDDVAGAADPGPQQDDVDDVDDVTWRRRGRGGWGRRR